MSDRGAVLVALVALIGLPACLAFSITDFGGVPFDSSDATAALNTAALFKTVQAANDSATDRLAEIPAGQNFTVFCVPPLSGLNNVTIAVNGGLIVSDNLTSSQWPKEKHAAALTIESSSFVEITGFGVFDGQGYDWWWTVFLTGHDKRPNLLNIYESKNILLHNLRFENSPRFHIMMDDVEEVVVRDLEIYVDVNEQLEIYKAHGGLDATSGLPIFPLNTDGCDIAGKNIFVENVTITNYDDTVCVKPLSGDSLLNQCAENYMIRNCKVFFGVGMTIGSVPPHDNVNCVRNVTFENIEFEHPIKAIYVKSNPGDVGTGIIDSVTYRNITANLALWYPLWIGPQQQQQPGRNGTGCSFLYPIVPECPTQPRVTMSNIVLQDVSFTGGLTLPGVLLCDPANPCTGFVFDNVTNDGLFLVSKDYVCKNVNGNVTNSSPAPSCF